MPTHNSTDAAEEAKKYGRLVILNEELTAKNASLKKENTELEEVVKNLSTLRNKEEIALQTLGQEANAARKAEKKRDKNIAEELTSRTKLLDAREKELNTREGNLMTNEEAVRLREDNVSAQEAGISTKNTDLTEKISFIKMSEERLDTREQELVAGAKEIKRVVDENKVLIKTNQEILDAISKEAAINTAALESNRTEIAKLLDLTEKMRSENDVNRKIKSQMELTIPRMHNLIAVLREFQDFISVHVKNPDAIDNKFTEIAQRLDIAINPPADVQ